MPSRVARFMGVVALLLLMGCTPRLNEKRSFTLEPGVAQVIDLPSISRPQRIVVEFSSDADVSVYIIKNFKPDDGMETPPKKEQTLSTTRGKSGNLTADVSPDTETRVIVRDAHTPAKVTLSVNNRR